MRLYFFILISLLCLIFSPLNAFSEGIPFVTGKMLSSGSITVDGKANIYGAGRITPPAPAGGGAGLLPPVIEFSPRETLQQIMIFPSITGEISCTTPGLFNDADGATFCLGKTRTESLDGLSGIKTNRTMFLAGVFLTDEEPYDPAPPTKDYTTYDESDDPVAIAMSQNVYTSKYAPQVNQVFFIGDGSSTVDNLQYCEIPAEASRLYLGFVDADDSGLVGFYDDNLGKLLVEYEIYNNYILDAPAPSVPQGLILYYTFDNQRQSVSEIGNLDDSSGFGFHGTLNHWDNESDEPLENYIEFPQEAKYANSVRFVDEKTSIVIANGTPYMYNSGTPPMADWTISTWFMCSHEHLILHVAPETKCMGHFNCYPGLLFGINPSNFELSAATTQFREGTMIIDLKYMGSGFYMNELEEGWHHLTATGTNGETRFFIDGEFVGKADTQSSNGLYQIKAWMLDDFRVYNRVLSLSEIRVLAEKSNALPANIFSDECIATYDSDGKLHIPCLNLSGDTDTSTLYDIILNQRPDNFTFDLDPLSIEIVNDFFDNVQ